MRLLTIILSVYFLLLTAVPCCAFDSCSDDDISTEQQQSKPHNDEDKGCNNCSPFFSCHSCSGFVVADVIQVQEETEVVYTRQNFLAMVQHYTPNYIPSSWQPPRA